MEGRGDFKASASGSREAKSNNAWLTTLQAVIRDSEGKPFDMNITSDDKSIYVTVPELKANEFVSAMTELLNAEQGSMQELEHKEAKEGKASDSKGDSKSEVKAGSQAAPALRRAIIKEPPAEDKIEDGLAIMKNLFGNRIPVPGSTPFYCEDVFDAKEGAEAKNGVLISRPLDPSTSLMPFDKVAIDLGKRFNGITIERIREAYSNENKQLEEVKGQETKSLTHIEKLFAECIRVVTSTNSQGKSEARVYVKYQQLYELLFPQQLIPMPQPDAEQKLDPEKRMREFKINSKQHFILHLQQLLNSKVLIAGKKGVFLAAQVRASQTPIEIIFPCDISGSMYTGKNGKRPPLDILKETLNKFAEKFRAKRLSIPVIIKIKPFGSEPYPTKAFPLSAINEMKEYIARMGDMTYGYRHKDTEGTKFAGAELALLQEILQEAKSNDISKANVIRFIENITDGADYNGEAWAVFASNRPLMQNQRQQCKTIINQLIELERSANITRPQIDTLACGFDRIADGQAAIDTETFCQELASLTGGDFFLEGDMEAALDRLMEKVEQMQHEREVLTVIETLLDEESREAKALPTTRNLAVFHNGEPQQFELIENGIRRRVEVKLNSRGEPVIDLSGGLSLRPSVPPRPAAQSTTQQAPKTESKTAPSLRAEIKFSPPSPRASVVASGPASAAIAAESGESKQVVAAGAESKQAAEPVAAVAAVAPVENPSAPGGPPAARPATAAPARLFQPRSTNRGAGAVAPAARPRSGSF